MITCLPGDQSGPLRVALLRRLPRLASHQHGHRVLKRLRREGGQKERTVIGRHVIANLPALVRDQYGREVVEAMVLSRVPDPTGQAWVLLERLVQLAAGGAARGELVVSRDGVLAGLSEGLGRPVSRLAEQYVANQENVMQRSDPQWKQGGGDRIRMYSWMQELACGEQPSVEFEDLPKLLGLLERANTAVNSESDRKDVFGEVRRAIVKLVKDSENFLQHGELRASQ
jgi:hypothetical protein